MPADFCELANFSHVDLTDLLLSLLDSVFIALLICIALYTGAFCYLAYILCCYCCGQNS